MTILIWNDKPNLLRSWSSTARASNCEVVETGALQPENVVARFRETVPDMVLLDLIQDESDEPLGIDIARAIRKIDNLVPIIVVTRDPQRIYKHGRDVDELDIIGLYDATIMRRTESFSAFVVRRPLNLWHELAPDFAITRTVAAALEGRFRGHDGEEMANRLAANIRLLPLSGAHDSWHKQLCGSLADFFREIELPNISAAYTEIVRVFETADPFYMAQGTSRKHLSHNIQVFLLGVLVLLEFPKMRKAAVTDLEPLTPGWSETRRLSAALAIWGGIATTHDVAYLSQHHGCPVMSSSSPTV
jgi:CheY-like chemotaxis protein